jgi:hypothetical protein
MGLCSRAEREIACPANGPTSPGTIMAKIDLRSRGRFAIFGRYEWASRLRMKLMVIPVGRSLFLKFNCRKHCTQSLSDLLGVLQGTRTSIF